LVALLPVELEKNKCEMWLGRMSKIELGQDVFSARFDTDILYRERFDAVPGRLYGWWWCITHEQGNRVVVAVGWFVKRSSICSAKYLGVPPNGKIESLEV
jgi:hypothetical protein